MSNITKLLVSVLLTLSLFPIKNLAQTDTDDDFSVVAIHDSAHGEEPDTVVVVKSPMGAMLRSIAVPGWGQLYNGKWFKAILVCGTEVGLIVNAVYQNQMAVQSKIPLEREWYQDNRNRSVWWLLAAILFSMADAYVDAHLYDFDESPDLSLRIDTLHFGNEMDPIFSLSLSMKL